MLLDVEESLILSSDNPLDFHDKTRSLVLLTLLKFYMQSETLNNVE